VRAPQEPLPALDSLVYEVSEIRTVAMKAAQAKWQKLRRVLNPVIVEGQIVLQPYGCRRNVAFGGDRPYPQGRLVGRHIPGLSAG
jgi:hypothetical protein